MSHASRTSGANGTSRQFRSSGATSRCLHLWRVLHPPIPLWIATEGSMDGRTCENVGVTTNTGRRAAAIMFTDVERFAETLERIGDEAAHRLLKTHNMIVRSRLPAHGGRELKSMGGW